VEQKFKKFECLGLGARSATERAGQASRLAVFMSGS